MKQKSTGFQVVTLSSRRLCLTCCDRLVYCWRVGLFSFGLSYNAGERAGDLEQNYMYNGKELQG